MRVEGASRDLCTRHVEVSGDRASKGFAGGLVIVKGACVDLVNCCRSLEWRHV